MATNNAINLGKYAFSAVKSSGNTVTGDGTVYQLKCDTAFVNESSVYNAGTGVWTAPETGNYFFGVQILYGSLAIGHTFNFTNITLGSGQIYWLDYSNPYLQSYNSFWLLKASIIIPVTAADTVVVNTSVSNGALAVNVINNLSGGTNTNPAGTMFFGSMVL